jgi:hypothetical protein
MGMYDTINFRVANKIIQECPNCFTPFSIEEDEWQTKSFENMLDTLSEKDLDRDFEMHTICHQCNHYISLSVQVKKIYDYHINKD